MDFGNSCNFCQKHFYLLRETSSETDIDVIISDLYTDSSISQNVYKTEHETASLPSSTYKILVPTSIYCGDIDRTNLV